MRKMEDIRLENITIQRCKSSNQGGAISLENSRGI